MTAVVLDAFTAPRLADDLQIKARALLEPLRLQELAEAVQLIQTILELFLDGEERFVHLVLGRDVVTRGVDGDGLQLLQPLTAQWIDDADRLHLVAEELDPNRHLVLRGREDLHDVSAHPKGAPVEVVVVAGVEDLHECPEELGPRPAVAHLEANQHAVVGLPDRDRRCSSPSHDDHILSLQQRLSRPVPELVDVLVDEQILLDVGVRGGDVCLRLVVVVVADEVLDRVVRTSPSARRTAGLPGSC